MASVSVSLAFGLWVEILQQKNHSLTKAAVAFALFGLIGAVTVVYRERRMMWQAGLTALIIGGWLVDFRHGLALSHQYANYAAFTMGVLFGLAKLLMDLNDPVPEHARRVSHSGFKPRKRSTRDLPELIRDITLALNHNFNMSPRQREFVELNLLAAVEGLAQVGRHEKAARLCGKVPTTLVRFDLALEGLEIEEGLKIANEAYKMDDWGTSLKMLDWALSAQPTPAWRRRIHATALIIAEQISQIDETFDAKVTALQLSAELQVEVRKGTRQTAAFPRRIIPG
jgi:hypothetical protein